TRPIYHHFSHLRIASFTHVGVGIPSLSGSCRAAWSSSSIWYTLLQVIVPFECGILTHTWDWLGGPEGVVQVFVAGSEVPERHSSLAEAGAVKTEEAI
ncbi:hypothetical protein PENTCL1PPCAC_20878, partial [Pristionchus entomophagus]